MKPFAFWPEYYDFNKDLHFKIKNKFNKISQEFPLENPSHFVLIMEDFSENDARVISEGESTREEGYQLLTVLISGGSNDPVRLIIRKYQYGDAVAK